MGSGGIWWDLVGSGGIWWWNQTIPPDPGSWWKSVVESFDSTGTPRLPRVAVYRWKSVESTKINCRVSLVCSLGTQPLGRFLGGAANGTKPPTARQSRPARQIQRKKSPNIKFNLGLLQPLFGDLVVCAPHDREDHALPIRWEPIFSAEERVLKRGRL